MTLGYMAMIFRLLVPDPHDAFSWNGEVDRKKELDPLVNAAFADELPPLERRFATVPSVWQHERRTLEGRLRY
jgi:hypothetical protein